MTGRASTSRTTKLGDDQHQQDVQSRVGCEQILNALTPPYKRNPTSIAKALAEDGYAVYDGPHPAGDGLAGKPPMEKDGSDGTPSQP